MIKTYYQLTKPGIIYGNLLTAAAGFLFASRWHIHIGLFLATLFGISLVIASACVVNNYLDREIDKKMTRTKKRAFVVGDIPVGSGLVFATALGVIGILLLGLFVNAVVVIIGLVGFFDYIVLYSLGKRRSVYGTIIGSVSGAMPVVAGYCAVSGRFNYEALLLFLIVVLWQMPHFYAIALYRLKDYKAAGLPVWPAARGIASTKRQIMGFILAFTLACIALKAFGYAGYSFAVVMAVIGVAWLHLGVKGFKTADVEHWARQMFFFSLIVILVLSLMLSIASVLA